MSIAPFAYVNADKAEFYRAVMAVFVRAKQRFIVHLRPDDVQQELPTPTPLDDIQTALKQLEYWGNLQSHPDTGRVMSVQDFYSARYLYQLTRAGEAVEAALAVYEETLGRRSTLQAVALADIQDRLRALSKLANTADPDPARVHALLRDLGGVFIDLTENAQSFMTSLGRALERRATDRVVFLQYKQQLIDYLEKFISDLVTLSPEIADLIHTLESAAEGQPLTRLLRLAAEREAADSAPDPDVVPDERLAPYLHFWHNRWAGLRAWFSGQSEQRSQAELLRARARRAIAELLETVTHLNERRLGRSDRSADFRTLAYWFAEARDDADAHRLWRAAFGLTPARHLGVDAATLDARTKQPVAASVPWSQAAPLLIEPRLRQTGSLQKRGAPAKVADRRQARAQLARQLADETAQTRVVRARLATGRETRLSELGTLDREAFRLFLHLLGMALAAATDPDARISMVTGDGALQVELEPLGPETYATIHCPDGVLQGRDYYLRITDLEKVLENEGLPA